MDRLPKIIVSIDKYKAYEVELFEGILKYANSNGRWLFFYENVNLKSFDDIEKTNPDGMILSLEKVDLSHLQSLSCKIPSIVLGDCSIEKDVVNIEPDCEMIGKLASEYLISLGFRNFAFFGTDSAGYSQDRAQSFINEIIRNGYEIEDYYCLENDDVGFSGELDSVTKWIKALRKPVAIMACDDNMGMKLLEACKAADIDIPEEVAILGVNNDRRNCELATPALSSIAMNAKKAGYDAAELLDDMIKSNTRKKSKKVIAEPVRIVARQSTNIFAVPDEFVVKALGFIVKNVNRQIQVTDAAEYVSISRRELERRFKRYLNRSIHQQIKYEKVKLIKKMLLESSDTISEIADKLGFSGAAHIGRYFKDVEGISPIEYRRKNLCTV